MLPKITLPEGYTPTVIPPPPEPVELGAGPAPVAPPAAPPRTPLPYTYRLTATASVLRSDGVVIPDDKGNADREEYALWLAAGHVPEVYVAPAVERLPVDRVTMRQARLALLGAGLLSQVEAALAALPEPARTAAKIEWEYSQEVHRHRGFVLELAGALKLKDADLNALFEQAAKL